MPSGLTPYANAISGRGDQALPVFSDAELARIGWFGERRHYRRGRAIGGGNSAGQAAVFFANHASQVHMLMRGEGLAASMSRYLIDRIVATPSIELHPNTEVTELCGDAGGRLASISWRESGVEAIHQVRNLFVFVGADQETEWLCGCGVVLDAHGFVVTGAPVRWVSGWCLA